MANMGIITLFHSALESNPDCIKVNTSFSTALQYTPETPALGGQGGKNFLLVGVQQASNRYCNTASPAATTLSFFLLTSRFKTQSCVEKGIRYLVRALQVKNGD